MNSEQLKQLNFEIQFYERLLKDKPDQADTLALIAEAYTRTGRHEDGLKADQHLAQLRPKDPLVFYNLACSYALLGHSTHAFESLEKSLQLGYQDIRHLKHDQDFKSLRSDERFQSILNKLQQK